MEHLPTEVLLHIFTFLEVVDIVRLPLVSKQFFTLCRDNELWRNICFDNSNAESNRQRLAAFSFPLVPIPDARVLELQRRATALVSSSNGSTSSEHKAHTEPKPIEKNLLTAAYKRLRTLANWDPSYPEETVDWYGEYIARHGPISMSWLQQPKIDKHDPNTVFEARGMALHRDSQGSRVVAPLENGGVAVWELSHDRKSDPADEHRRGALVGQSRGELLSADGPGGAKALGDPSMKKSPSPGIVDCVSVDNFRNKAYFAIGTGLNEVDLHTLQVSHHQKYPFDISALSEASYPTPLTVGTTFGLVLHDPRRSNNSCWSDPNCIDRVDNAVTFLASPPSRGGFFRLLLGDHPLDHATLGCPGPLAIHHVPSLGVQDTTSGEIYVAGRFASVLIYDRRNFPKLRNTIYSGARICSLTSLPHPFRSVGAGSYNELDLPSPQAVSEAKSVPGRTLIASGDYKGKGSLEMYDLGPDGGPFVPVLGNTQSLSSRNRVNASRSKLLSVATHGTRLVVSDGDGYLRWFERDGSTFVRRWSITRSKLAEISRVFNSSGTDCTTMDVARKLIATNGNADGGHVDRDELLVWTGERIGVLAFRKKPQFGVEEWEERVETLEEKVKRKEERIYGQTMRRALERQADEVRFMRGLGERVRK
ncbi:hypothetical protein MMC13_005070 [Lambiella insularis]|nr:hypothetical protein [Lambiella insularis]